MNKNQQKNITGVVISQHEPLFFSALGRQGGCRAAYLQPSRDCARRGARGPGDLGPARTGAERSMTSSGCQFWTDRSGTQTTQNPCMFAWVREHSCSQKNKSWISNQLSFFSRARDGTRSTPPFANTHKERSLAHYPRCVYKVGTKSTFNFYILK